MDFNQIFELRRTINEFEDKKIPNKLIIEAIKAGNLAPCHRLTFPWRFKNVRQENRLKIARRYKTYFNGYSFKPNSVLA